jgi:hypothetical protein
MKHIILGLASAAAILATVGQASAQSIVIQTPGYYGDGPRRGYYREGYNQRYEDRRYRRGYARQCRTGFTVQDGVCKPYRGY